MLNVEQGGMSREYILKIKVNPNTTFYSYYFFPRAPRSDFEVLFFIFFLRGEVGRVGHVRPVGRVGPVRLKVSECGERGGCLFCYFGEEIAQGGAIVN